MKKILQLIAVAILAAFSLRAQTTTPGPYDMIFFNVDPTVSFQVETFVTPPATGQALLLWDNTTLLPYYAALDSSLTWNGTTNVLSVNKAGLGLTTADVSGLGSAATQSASSFQSASSNLTSLAAYTPSTFPVSTPVSTAISTAVAAVPAQVNADWNSSSGLSKILNKPTLAAVATTGAYSSLTGTPNTPALVNRAIVTTSAGGAYTWTYPTAFPASTVPVIEATAVGSGSTLYNCQLVSVSNTQALIQTNSATAVLGILTLTTNVAATVHLMAISP